MPKKVWNIFKNIKLINDLRVFVDTILVNVFEIVNTSVNNREKGKVVSENSISYSMTASEIFMMSEYSKSLQ